jgi:hypothetical protein
MTERQLLQRVIAKKTGCGGNCDEESLEYLERAEIVSARYLKLKCVGSQTPKWFDIEYHLVNISYEYGCDEALRIHIEAIGKLLRIFVGIELADATWICPRRSDRAARTIHFTLPQPRTLANEPK